MNNDWNGDGKHDWQDGFIDYKLTSGSDSSNSGSTSKRPGSFRIPTWLLVLAVVGIVSGELPINGFTVLLAVIMAVVIWARMLS